MCFPSFPQKWLVGQVVTKEKLDEAAEIYRLHLGADLFNYEGAFREGGRERGCVLV